MRPNSGRRVISVNFEIIVSERIFDLARKEKISVSEFINTMMKRLVMDELVYYTELAKVANANFQRILFIKEQLEKDKK